MLEPKCFYKFTKFWQILILTLWFVTLPCFLAKIAQILQKVILFFLERRKKIEHWFWHIWIAEVVEVFLHYSLSFSISAIFRGKWVIKVGPKVKTLGSSVFHENSNPSNFFQTMHVFARLLPLVRILAILHHIWGSKGPKTSQEGPWYAKLWKLLT